MAEPLGRVVFVGAGPGDPGLVTARGARLLAEADVVVYDRAVAAVLRWAAADAERIDVGAPAEHSTAQDAISLLLAEKAREGSLVVRLKWGDAFVFDSGGKEALFLHEQGIPFDVIPGIPAAIGTPAYAGVPLTYPGSGDALVLLRGHEDERDQPPDVDWSALARLDGTIVCYASARVAGLVLESLLEHGRPADQPAVLIYCGTLPRQHTVAGTLVELATHAAESKEADPAILVVGEVTSLRDHLRWFDERPLFGRRIVVTRSRDQARELVELLENLGAEPIEAPTYRLAPPDDPEALERAAASVPGQRWVVFESANAVVRFLGALCSGPRDLRALGGVRVCAIGPSTADRLTARGIKPDVVIPEFRVDVVIEAMAERGALMSERVLIVRPDHPILEPLAAELVRRGAVVTDVIAYRTLAPSPEMPEAQALYRMLLDGRIDAVTFTTPTSVQRFADLLGAEQTADLLKTTTVAAIGPVTAAAARELGIETTIVPDAFTVEGLVAALVKHFQGRAART